VIHLDDAVNLSMTNSTVYDPQGIKAKKTKTSLLNILEK